MERKIEKPTIEWVSIPAGTFTMGSPKTELNRGDDETQHQVTLSAFKMSKYEVTFEQYDAFCKATGREKPDDLGMGRGKRPVTNVSWDDAKAFADWMGCCLPTEAEWEYACRAGTTTPFNTGNNLTTSQANYDGNYPYNGNAEGEYREEELPVGSFAPNAYGLYDMHGNVREWCSDRYGDYPTVAQTNPKGPATGSDRVFRGGGSSDFASNCRSAKRYSDDPGYRDDCHLGFRIVERKIEKPTIEWVNIPKGTFTMGSPASEADRQDDETQHQVTLSAFKMSKYEVTVGQFKAFIDATGYVTDADKGTGGKGSVILTGETFAFVSGVNWKCDVKGKLRPATEYNHPVIHVSWNDAKAFADWMECRLPTEAEWEYACRAGTTTPFNTGNNLATSQANYNCNYPYYNNNNEKGEYRAKTLPVGSFSPNNWGLYDMHGNVWEWCADYCNYDNDKKVLITDTYINGIKDPMCWKGPLRAGRGGFWDGDVKDCRAAKRSFNFPDDHSCINGFRLVSPFMDRNTEKPTIEWVRIPSGTFIMGSPQSEEGRNNDETQHQVTLSAFKMSRYEVTFEQYDAFCKATGRKKPDDEGWGRGERPVINVSWDDAKAFANWMGCRLPTEAEWEYACRAGTTTPFNTGNNLTTSQANYNGYYPYNDNAEGEYGKKTLPYCDFLSDNFNAGGESREKTLPVCSFFPNAWGLYDMHGNVWEWCEDYCNYNYDKDKIITNTYKNGIKDPLCRTGSDHIFRGGCWNSVANSCRSACRGDLYYVDLTNIGFRLVSPK